jgi:hypothetical protein
MLLAGAQVAVVGALLAVVYFTLLKPDDDSALFGVDAPSERPRVAQQQPTDREPGERGRERPPAERVTAAGPSGGPSGALIQPAGAPTPIPSSEPIGDESPGDDQYQSTLARLRDLTDPGG